MKTKIVNVLSNSIAAIILFTEGATELNNLIYSIAAILCVIAAISGIVSIKKEHVNNK